MLKDKEKEFDRDGGKCRASPVENEFHSRAHCRAGKKSKCGRKMSIFGSAEAQAYNISSDKMRKELEEHDGLKRARGTGSARQDS